MKVVWLLFNMVEQKVQGGYHSQVEFNHTALKEATQLCHSVVKAAQKEHWEYIVNEKVTTASDFPKVCKKVRDFRKSLVPLDNMLLIEGRRTSNAMEKAKALADTFFKVSQTRHLQGEPNQAFAR